MASISRGAGAVENIHPLRKLQAAMSDIDAKKGYVIDQASGKSQLLHGIERIGFFDNTNWLP